MLEERLGLHETRAKNPISILATLMFDIPDPYDKDLADLYWRNPEINHEKIEAFMQTKAVVGKRLPLEEFIKIVQ